MRNLPSERKEKIQDAKKALAENGKLVISLCNCFRPETGDFGKAEIHPKITLVKDDEQIFVDEGTCSTRHRTSWHPVESAERVITKYADLL